MTHINSVAAQLGANALVARPSDRADASARRGQPYPPEAPADALRPSRARADQAWIRRVIDREGPGIVRMLWRILGREHDVMDAFQDCFCKLATADPRRVRKTRAYAYRTAANIAIEMIRSRKRRAAHLPAIARASAQRSTLDASPDRAFPDGPATNAEGYGQVRRGHISSRLSGEPLEPHHGLRQAIARLPAHLRNVIVLRDLSRMSYKEVGRSLGITPSTARVYRRHAVVQLADLLKKKGREP